MDRDLNRHFSEGEIQVTYRHMKRSSVLLIIREIHTQSTMRYHVDKNGNTGYYDYAIFLKAQAMFHMTNHLEIYISKSQ